MPKPRSAARSSRHDDAGHRTRTRRRALGTHRRPRPDPRRDCSRLHRSDLGDRPTRHHHLGRCRLAIVRQLDHRPRPQRRLAAPGQPSTHRALQALARHPREPARPTTQEDRRSIFACRRCASSSNDSSNGTTPTPRHATRSCGPTCPRWTNRCRSSSTTTKPPSSWPPPSDSTRNDDSSSSCWREPGCASPSSVSSPTTPSSP